MKKTTTIMSLMCILFTVQAHANLINNFKSLTPPKSLYNQLGAVFNPFLESIGGFSYEISLQSLECSISLKKAGLVQVEDAVETACTATNYDEKQIDASGAAVKELILTLLTNGIKLDTLSEAGTAYLSIKNLNCSYIEPRTNDPIVEIEPTYSCEANIN